MSHFQEGKIKDVFEDNLEEELRKISDLVEEYNFISMVSLYSYTNLQDTEFPGIVFPLNQNSNYTSKNIDSHLLNPNFHTNTKNDTKSTNQFTEANYKNIKLNVDNLKMIQIGITLANELGEFPEPISTWQFNFKFNLE